MDGEQQEKKGMDLARDLAWDTLAAADPAALADRGGATWNAAERAWRLPYLRFPVTVSSAERALTAEGTELTLMEEVLILRYLWIATGVPPSGAWISFRELPGGKHYVGPFWGRTGRPVSARFGADAPAFVAASEAVGGDKLSFGDASFVYRVLPKLWLGIVLYLGDDEFPAEVSILFDATVRDQFTTEDCAAAAQALCRRLLKAAPSG